MRGVTGRTEEPTNRRAGEQQVGRELLINRKITESCLYIYCDLCDVIVLYNIFKLHKQCGVPSFSSVSSKSFQLCCSVFMTCTNIYKYRNKSDI